ncbi:cytochrome b [Salinibius halmophilus]|uniref:cytochrome b n=1 Tax=Salinibius halmophilus TaxID=1853216 RepID=UPI000E675935|nr:cytochrome b/b6 domain-containing protein [Salinibius halmophilus]
MPVTMHFAEALLIAGQQFNLNLSEGKRLFGLAAHSSIGSIGLLLALLFFAKRFILRHKRPHVELPLMQKLMATGAQLSLYSLAILVPATGLLAAIYSPNAVNWLGFINIAQFANEQSYQTWRNWHELSTFTVLAILSAHAGAAMYHHLIKKDAVLKAMLGEKLAAKIKSSG